MPARGVAAAARAAEAAEQRMPPEKGPAEGTAEEITPQSIWKTEVIEIRRWKVSGMRQRQVLGNADILKC